MENTKPTLESLTAVYSQATDSCSEADVQFLTIKNKDAGAGNYYVISTDEWAIDNIEDLIETLKDFEMRLK